MNDSPIQDIYPLSPTQRGLLFHSLYAPNSGVYLIQVCFSLRGTLNPDAFARAWQLLAARHDPLRTAFAWDKLDAPLQVVGKRADIPCSAADISLLPVNEQAETLAVWLADDRGRGFGMARAPLMRVQRFKLAENLERVICSYHHILLDGWSLPILLREWLQLYTAECNDTVAALPAPPRYRSYIDWLRKQDPDGAQTYWRSLLADFSEANRLPAERGSRIGQAPDMALIAETVAADLSRALTETARRLRVTPSTLVQAAWALLLGRYSGRNDVVFGVTRAGRPAQLAGVQQMPGLFITTLPIRAEIAFATRLGDWLGELQQQLTAQQAHEHLPLSEVLRLSGLTPGQPLFESIVVFENYPSPAAHPLQALTMTDIAVLEQTHYPLALFAFAGERLELKLQFDRARIDTDGAARLLAQLPALFRTFCADTEIALGRLDLTTGAERELAARGNRTACPPPAASVAAMIAARAAEQPGRTALIDAVRSLSYAELAARAANLAGKLAANGIGPGQRVAIGLARGVDMVAAILAVWYRGAAYVPLDPNYPRGRLNYMLDDSACAALIVHAPTREKLAFWPGLSIDLDRMAGEAADPIPAEPNSPRAPAYLIYTSGSSGQPKGVVITHRNLANLLLGMHKRIGFDFGDTWLAVTTLCFDIAGLELLLPLIAGGRCAVAMEDEVNDGKRLRQRLADYAVSHLQATPTTWRLLLQAGWQGRPGLTLLCGGESLDAPLARQLLDRGKTLWNVYGPTETTIWSGALELSEALLDGATAPIGGAIDNTAFHVLDPYLRPVPIGGTGELYIGGMGLSPGYFGKPALSADKFPPNPLPQPEDADIAHGPLLYRTGDRVRLRADGHFDFLGRLDRQSKLRGYRIELEEIENLLGDHADIEQAVVAIEGDGADARLCAYLKLKAGADETESTERLRRHLAERLPVYMLPASYTRVAEFPLTPNGKIDRNALAALASAPVCRSEAPPAGGLQARLLSIWRQALQNEGVGVHDHFFEVGGHSLLLMTVQSQLRQQLQIELELVELFQYPTIASLSRYLQQRAGGAANREPTSSDAGAGRERLAERRSRVQLASRNNQ